MTFNPAETIALVNEQRLFMVRRTGEASAFDLADGQRVGGWRHEPGLIQVHLAALNAYGLVLAGYEACMPASTASSSTAENGAGSCSTNLTLSPPMLANSLSIERTRTA